MPETNRPPRYRSNWTLMSAERTGQVVRVSCHLCRARHHYLPQDMLTLFGDIDIDELEQRLRCGACGRKDYVQVKLWVPSAEERQALTLRRLVRVQTRRVPIWRDEEM